MSKIYPICAKTFALCLIVTVNFYSLGAPLHLNENSSQVLRPASYQNGNGGSGNFYTTPSSSANAPALDGFIWGHSKEGVTTTNFFDGAGALWNIGPDGEQAEPETLVPAGMSAKSSAPGRLQSLTENQIEAVPEEFSGTYLHFAYWQLWVSHVSAMEKSKGFQAFTRNKVIGIDTGFLPDFDLNQPDSDATRLAKEILKIWADELIGYRRDIRFSSHQGKIYIDFVSREGPEAEAKRNAVVALFNSLADDNRRYRDVEKMLFSEGFGPADRLTITHKDNAAEFSRNPVLLLDTKAIAEKRVMVYPWDTLMDLSVGILSIDRDIPLIQQQEAYQAVKGLFEDLINILDMQPKDELLQRLDNILEKLLSNKPTEYINAALELILPPVQKLDLETIDDLIEIMKEVARWA